VSSEQDDMKLKYTFLQMNFTPFLVMCLALFSHPCEGARILAVFPFPAQSHVNVLSGLTKALAARGHELVVASPIAEKKPLPNYTEIDLMPSMKKSKENSVGPQLYQMHNMKFYELWFTYWSMGLETTEAAINSPQLKKILDDKKGFDLIITEAFLNEAFYGLAHHFKVKNSFC